jgi:hypothetical protein
MTPDSELAGEFERDGFVTLEDMVSAGDLAAFESEIGEISEHYAQSFGLSAGGDTGLIEAFRRGGNLRKVLYGMIQGLPSIRALTEVAIENLWSSGLLSARGIGLPSILTNLRVDLPNEERFLLPMHQDYAGMRSHNAVRLWLPLRAVDAEAGTMYVVRGSHAQGYLPHDLSDPASPSVKPSEFDSESRELVELGAGSGVFFDMFMLHQSVPNVSQRIKFVLVLTIQDLLKLADPDDPDDSTGRFFHIHDGRTKAREENS